MQLIINSTTELRPFAPELAETYFAAIHRQVNPNDAQRSLLQGKYDTLQKVRARIEDAVTNKYLLDGTPDFFILYQGEIVGVFEVHPLVEGDFIEVGFWLFEEHRRRGIMHAVMNYMVNYLAPLFPRPKILATTATQNIASQRLLSSCGFIKEDTDLIFIDEAGNPVEEFSFVKEMSRH